MAPILVIVPGSFAPASLYNDWVANLKDHGVRTIVISLPSVGRQADRPAQTMTDDVNEIIQIVGGLLDDGEDVVLLTHSYGGVPGTQSLEILSNKARQAGGKKGVSKIIYMTSVILPVGTSNLEAFGGSLPDFVSVDGDFMSMKPGIESTFTFSGLPDEEALQRSSTMESHSLLSFKEKLRYAGYNDVDEVHYILCEEDKIIPPEFQAGMIELIKTSSGKDVTVHKIKADHAPNVSQPEKMTELVKGIISSTS